jgi:uncharacterized membrane protein YuzA (DUF378 family)
MGWVWPRWKKEVKNMKRLIWLDIIVLLLVIIGALNWGLVGFFQYNLVSTIFGNGIDRIIYVIVGIAGLYLLGWELPRIFHKDL